MQCLDDDLFVKWIRGSSAIDESESLFSNASQLGLLFSRSITNRVMFVSLPTSLEKQLIQSIAGNMVHSTYTWLRKAFWHIYNLSSWYTYRFEPNLFNIAYILNRRSCICQILQLKKPIMVLVELDTRYSILSIYVDLICIDVFSAVVRIVKYFLQYLQVNTCISEWSLFQ